MSEDQKKIIADLYREVESVYADKIDNLETPTLEGLFYGTPEGDFDWESDPEDVGVPWSCDERDCPERWHMDIQYVSMGRKDGKHWFVVYADNFAGSGDYQPMAGFDEREGDEIDEITLIELGQAACQGRLHHHFRSWALYDLYCAETGADPLKNWHRPFTTEDAIKSAQRNLDYLKM
jgi:hypothetical protein